MVVESTKTLVVDVKLDRDEATWLRDLLRNNEDGSKYRFELYEKLVTALQ